MNVCLSMYIQNNRKNDIEFAGRMTLDSFFSGGLSRGSSRFENLRKSLERPLNMFTYMFKLTRRVYVYVRLQAAGRHTFAAFFHRENFFADETFDCATFSTRAKNIGVYRVFVALNARNDAHTRMSGNNDSAFTRDWI